jgi:glycosyltransferase involved in cell wall biosynthesis
MGAMGVRNEPLVSVVTPVYNGEQYLRECVESVLAQTYTNWEHVIVNNRSTDRTLEIAREYAARDPRIRVHDNETFVRIVANHNIAFRLISPESVYCKVLGADDWLFPECLEKMVGLAEEHPSVAIVQSYRLQGTKVAGDGVPFPSTVVPGRDACRMWLLPSAPSILGAPSATLYRADIVRSRDSFWNEGSIHADTEACLEFLEHRDYGFVHQVLVYYRLREDSMTSFSVSSQTYLPARLSDLVTYGPRYLSDSELERSIRVHLRLYYRALGSQVFKRRDRDFWSLHRGKLASMGYPLSAGRLAANVVWYPAGLVLDPRRTAEKVAERLRRRVRGATSSRG